MTSVYYIDPESEQTMIRLLTPIVKRMKDFIDALRPDIHVSRRNIRNDVREQHISVGTLLRSDVNLMNASIDSRPTNNILLLDLRAKYSLYINEIQTLWDTLLQIQIR